MNDRVDLHLHSCYSDGALSPACLLKEAAACGLRAVALTDHDNVDGIDEALAAGRELGVEVLTGVELSVVWQDLNDLHLLGYGFDHRHPPLVQALAGFRTFRAGRSLRILANINRLLSASRQGAIEPAAVQARAGGTIGRPHIARELVDRGLARDMEHAFERFLVPCNEPKRYFPMAEAIDLIHAAGGCAVLAHPSYIKVPEERLRALAEGFVAMGLDGIEAYYSGSDNLTIDRHITLARQLGLIVTGGSDFHEARPGGVTIGSGYGSLKIPYRCVEEIRQRCTDRISAP
ncbi:MAG: PHP domain-containing protein [Desulfuromonadales bacterium]|nr:PHP domain-containing protein [Desulfuromonadales bacterium]